MGFILFLVSEMLMFIVKPINWGYSHFLKLKRWVINFSFKKMDNEFLLKAIMNDKLSNRLDSALLTKLFITDKSKHKFGNPNETISSVLGKNFLAGTLTEQGYDLCELLNDLQPNHVIKSIDNSVW